MSRVTNIIILFSCSENEELIIEKLFEFNYNDNLPFVIKSIQDKSLPKSWYGGAKFFESSVLIGAYNFLEINLLISYMKTIEWEYPEDVQILYKEDGNTVFKLISPLVR